MTVAKIVHFLKWIDKHETLCLNCSNEEIADQYLASHPAQAGGMPVELPTDEEIMQESHYRYTHNCKPLKSDRFHFEDGANWLKSRITETKNK